MTALHGATIGRRRLRSALRAAREGAGLTQEQVADAMDWSLSKVIRIEAGAVSVSTNDVKALLNHYRLTDAEQVAELVDLARISRRRTWWSRYRDGLPAPYLSYIGLEVEASSLLFFQSVGIPGLLQTDAYARASTVASLRFAVEPFDLDIVDDVRARRRHEVLDRADPPSIEVVLDESVLHRQTGGVVCLRDQLRHLVDVGSTSHITIQVLPFQVPDYAVRAPFIVVRFPGVGDTDVVFVGSPLSQDLTDTSDTVEPYVDAFRTLQAMSLDPAASLARIARIADDLR
ncbi:helix-turn-helix domain-containing protein [Polymorphospora rubra]|uniref:Transcriptional regulator n=1 Tax=Polymorphospora rubra TaxID=338584 RepID=A0A810MVG1_9ACTN|nr:helix-turn-helix transcriptional regulator [Polymorphospora rubra]BCJ63989.1 transcriptional regulator [Polymorphospora rubra]